MDTVLNQCAEWLKNMIVPSLMAMLSSMFDSVNTEVGNIATDVAITPSAFSPEVFRMIRTVSENVIMPIAGILLTYVACYELIQIVVMQNNLADMDLWFLFKWVLKTFIAVELITHTFDITLAVFDVAQFVIDHAGGVITESTAVDASALAGMESTIRAMDVWGIFFLFIQVWLINVVTWLLSKIIFVIIYARMIEIYLWVSLAPIPFATFANREQGVLGQNYIRSLFALGFQGFLILICVGVYAVLIKTLTFSSDIIGSIWGVFGYTILLTYSLFKTSSIAKSVMQSR